jgi:hypothetical protein
MRNHLYAQTRREPLGPVSVCASEASHIESVNVEASFHKRIHQGKVLLAQSLVRK